MGYNIRPLSFGEVLDRAFAVLRDHFWLIVAISAVFYIPNGVLLGFHQVASGAVLRVATYVVFAVYGLTAGPVTAVAIATTVARICLDKPVTISDAYRSTGPLLGRIIGTYLLFYVLLIFSFSALFVPGVYFATCWALLAPVMIAEKRFGMTALRRSRELVRGVWWRTLGIFLIALIITQLPTGAVHFFWGHIPFLGPILDGAASAVTSTYMGVLIVVYYFDRRCRTEDFDLRLLAERIRSEAETATQPMPRTSPVA